MIGPGMEGTSPPANNAQLDPKQILIDRKSPIPYYAQVKDLLSEKIESGEWLPGIKLPGEPELCRVFDVSRTVIRQALQELTHAGYLVREKGIGTFVAEPKMEHSPSSLTSFSRLMESKGHGVETIVLDQTIISATPKAIRNLNLPPETPVVYIRRIRKVDGIPVAIHTSYLPAERFSALVNMDLTGSLWSAILEVSGIGSAYTHDVIEATLLREDEAAHLHQEVGSPAFLMNGIAFTQEKVPFRYTQGVYRGDRINFIVDGGLVSFSFETEKGHDS